MVYIWIKMLEWKVILSRQAENCLHVQYASKEARFISQMPTVCPPNTINRGDSTMEEREVGMLMGPCVPCYNLVYIVSMNWHEDGNKWKECTKTKNGTSHSYVFRKLHERGVYTVKKSLQPLQRFFTKPYGILNSLSTFLPHEIVLLTIQSSKTRQ